MRRLLVIEGEPRPDQAAIHDILAGPDGYSCHFACWQDVSMADVVNCPDDLVLAVTTTDRPHFLEILTGIPQQRIKVPVLVVLPADADEELIKLTSRAADDFIVLPFGAAELRHRIARLLAQPQHDLEAVRRTLIEEMSLNKLLGRDPVFVQAIAQLPRFARANVPVCITGETGTGKELCARAVHNLSKRQAFPFIAVDCGALPEQLFENEMFGHARGAFTDAHRDYKGLVAMAEGGTLFLDEVDALSLSSQAKLLRLLQEHTYRPLGSDRFEPADVRVVAATNRDLEGCVRERQFRQDLYFRLNVLRLRLPPLRDRRGDIELLAYAALKEHGGGEPEAPASISLPALRMLTLYDWPGNVRELYNVLQRAMVACDGDRVLPEHLELPTGNEEPPAEAEGGLRTERAAVVAAFERRFVEDLLRKHHGNVTQAAREARQDRRAFGRVIKKHNIDRNRLIA